MAEAEDHSQASIISSIPDSIVQQTVQQIDVSTLGASQPPCNQLAANQVGNGGDTGTLLNTLQDFVGKFTQFQQQAEIDRNRVDLLLKQFENNGSSVTKKPKTPKRGASVKNNNSVEQCIASVSEQVCTVVNNGAPHSVDSVA